MFFNNVNVEKRTDNNPNASRKESSNKFSAQNHVEKKDIGKKVLAKANQTEKILAQVEINITWISGHLFTNWFYTAMESLLWILSPH